MFPSKTILLIEDHPMFSQIMQCAIEIYTPHKIIHRWNGDQIFELLSQYHPHLLVLDYNLSGPNGIELYDLIHATPDFEQLPAMMVSADLPVKELQRRQIPGLYKPFPVQDFLQVVDSLLNSCSSPIDAPLHISI